MTGSPQMASKPFKEQQHEMQMFQKYFKMETRKCAELNQRQQVPKQGYLQLCQNQC